MPRSKGNVRGWPSQAQAERLGLQKAPLGGGLKPFYLSGALAAHFPQSLACSSWMKHLICTTTGQHYDGIGFLLPGPASSAMAYQTMQCGRDEKSLCIRPAPFQHAQMFQHCTGSKAPRKRKDRQETEGGRTTVAAAHPNGKKAMCGAEDLYKDGGGKTAVIGHGDLFHSAPSLGADEKTAI